MDTIGTWRCIFDEENHPIFELASKYKLAVEVHPYDSEKFIKLQDDLAVSSNLDASSMCRCISFLHIGYQDKFPDMQVCFAIGQLSQIIWETHTRL